jgi:hypothetical protein
VAERRATASSTAFIAAAIGIVTLITPIRAEAEPRSTDAQADSADAPEGGPDVESGPELAVRTGYATSFGRIQPGKRIRGEIAGAIPLWIDVGYRFNRRWFAGAYGHYGLAFQAATSESKCPDCQHSWIRVGVQGQYRFVDKGSYNLWLGLGIGREYLNEAIDETEERSSSITGWEWFNLQVGSELQPTEGLGLGPYLSLGLGDYVQQTETCLRDDRCPIDERRVETPLSDSGIHGWFNAGVRLVLLP